VEISTHQEKAGEISERIEGIFRRKCGQTSIAINGVTLGLGFSEVAKRIPRVKKRRDCQQRVGSHKEEGTSRLSKKKRKHEINLGSAYNANGAKPISFLKPTTQTRL